MDIIRKGCSAQNFGKKIANIPLASIVHAISDPRFERRQVMDFLVRLRVRILPFKPNGYQYSIASYFQSDLGRATALDHHVNRPHYVERDIGRSLDRFLQIIQMYREIQPNGVRKDRHTRRRLLSIMVTIEKWRSALLHHATWL